MAAIFPPEHVPAPAAGPRRYGLFNAATILDLPIHARTGGVQFEPDTCGIARAYTAACPPSEQDAKTLTDLSTVMTATPFVVYASVLCAPVGRSPEEQQRRAIQRLYAGEQNVSELALWNGAGVGATPALTLAGATVVVTAATAFHARIAALEEAFYDAYGYQGTIHVNTRANGAAAFSQMLVRPTPPPDVPAHAITPLGSIWSFGAGYDITGPANVAPAAGSVWAFMTGPVTIWRASDGDLGLPDPRQTFNRTTNQMTAVAEREYVQSYDCPTVFAIEVPVTGP
jgi:hypothetical protein